MDLRWLWLSVFSVFTLECCGGLPPVIRIDLDDNITIKQKQVPVTVRHIGSTLAAIEESPNIEEDNSILGKLEQPDYDCEDVKDSLLSKHELEDEGVFKLISELGSIASTGEPSDTSFGHTGVACQLEKSADKTQGSARTPEYGSGQIKMRSADGRLSHFCLYCEKSVVRIRNHLKTKHREENEVKEAMKNPKTCQKDWQFRRIINKGDLKHSSLCNEDPIVCRKPNVPWKNDRYFTCPFCKGWLKRKHRSFHTKACRKLAAGLQNLSEEEEESTTEIKKPAKKCGAPAADLKSSENKSCESLTNLKDSTENVSGETNVIQQKIPTENNYTCPIESQQFGEGLFEEVLDPMVEDKGPRVVRNKYMHLYASRLWRQNLYENSKSIRKQLRDLLLLEDCMNEILKANSHLQDFMHVSYIPAFITIIKNRSGFVKLPFLPPTIAKPTVVSRLCLQIEKFAEFYVAMLEREENVEKHATAQKFLATFASESEIDLKNVLTYVLKRK